MTPADSLFTQPQESTCPPVSFDALGEYKKPVLTVIILLVVFFIVLTICFMRLVLIISRYPPRRARPSKARPSHLLVVLGSGGHTAEMLNMLSSLPTLHSDFTYRTYLVSAGDAFSALKAKEFENKSSNGSHYAVVTVRRARRVHQPFLTAPFTTLQSLWDCIAVLRGTHLDLQGTEQLGIYPDLILTNGPGTGVCVVVASILLQFFGYSGKQGGQMRTIFIESWARVKTLSLSGKILRPMVNRFLVQWPQLAKLQGEGTEYKGPLVT